MIASTEGPLRVLLGAFPSGPSDLILAYMNALAAGDADTVVSV